LVCWQEKPMMRPHDYCCGDCLEYGREIDGQCEIFNKDIAALENDYGEMEKSHTDSACKKFKPSAELLKYLYDEAAYQREQYIREMREQA
jgi:iron-sulfur cluster repair protein YtfE (RIC family)